MWFLRLPGILPLYETPTKQRKDMLNFDEICHLFYGDNVPQDAIEDDWDRDYEPDPDLQVKAAKEDALID